jgi:hypothetical protein
MRQTPTNLTADIGSPKMNRPAATVIAMPSATKGYAVESGIFDSTNSQTIALRPKQKSPITTNGELAIESNILSGSRLPVSALLTASLDIPNLRRTCEPEDNNTLTKTKAINLKPNVSSKPAASTTLPATSAELVSVFNRQPG